MVRGFSDIDTALAAKWLHHDVPTITVTITNVSGSAPRAAGASMLVTQTDISGTVGGGALEWGLIANARQMLNSGEADRDIEQALGPELGQCCGGRIMANLSRLTKASLRVTQSETVPPTVCIYGAGHVGAALARALAALPLTVEVIDQRAALLAPLVEFGLITETPLPEAHIASVRANAAYVVATHNHALDFMIVEAALRRGDAAYVGMIGSASKRAVLARQLAKAGLSDHTLTCPIGAGFTPDKRPELIAAATVSEIVAALF